jgi:hypothetical protein
LSAAIALRHIARRRPEELARAFVPEGCPVEVLGWIDTQVTKLERRPDKALRLRVAGKPRVLHVEFCFALRADVPDRIFEYLGFIFTVLRAEAPAHDVPPIKSVAVVLTGPRRRLPATARRCTAWPDDRFSGAHFRVDAVYQRTVAELRARSSTLWLVFTPLARDADPSSMREIVAEIRDGATNDEERGELYAALLVMAIIDPWGHNLRREIGTMLEDEEHDLFRRMPVLGDMIVEAEKLALERGEKLGREEALAQLLGRLFARRLGRRPTTTEERCLVERAEVLGPERVEDALLDLERDALVRWLAEPGAS